MGELAPLRVMFSQVVGVEGDKYQSRNFSELYRAWLNFKCALIHCNSDENIQLVHYLVHLRKSLCALEALTVCLQRVQRLNKN